MGLLVCPARINPYIFVSHWKVLIHEKWTHCLTFSEWNNGCFILWEWDRWRQTDEQKKESRTFCVDVFLAVNQYANEAWSIILLQLISVNPQSRPGHCSCTQACLGEQTHSFVHTHWILHLTFQKNETSALLSCLLNTTLFFASSSNFNIKTQ